MRKIFRTAVSLAMGCALLSTSAFAAGAGTAEFVDGKLNIGITTASGDEQVAIVVVKGSGENLTIDENATNVAYIDQEAATNGNVSRTGINVGDATEVSVFAGYASNKTDKAVYIGGARSVTTGVGLTADKTSVSTGEEAVLTVDLTGDAVGKEVIFEGTGAAYITNNAAGNKAFKSVIPGSYTVKATVMVDGVKYESTEVTIEVTKAALVVIDRLHTPATFSDDAVSGDQYGIGAAVKVTVPAAKNFVKMIWAFDLASMGDTTFTDKQMRFSKPIAISAASGDVQYAASFLAGTKSGNDKLELKAVNGVQAIFLDSDGVEYFTDEDLSSYKE